MFEKQERTGLIVKIVLQSRQKITPVGDVLYHSKKCRYVQLYVDKDKADQAHGRLKERTLCQKVLPFAILKI